MSSIVYVGDVLIFSEYNCHHVKDTNKLLKMLRQAGATLKQPMFHFFEENLNILDTRLCLDN